MTADKLRQIDQAEDAVRRLGFEDLRVRHHGDVARLELPAADLARAVSDPLREQVLRAVRAAGFRFVAVDLRGIQSGAFTLDLLQIEPAAIMAEGEADDLSGFADLDLGRAARRGFPEAVYCAGKTPEQVGLIAAALGRVGHVTLFTKAGKAMRRPYWQSCRTRSTIGVPACSPGQLSRRVQAEAWWWSSRPVRRTCPLPGRRS